MWTGVGASDKYFERERERERGAFSFGLNKPNLLSLISKKKDIQLSKCNQTQKSLFLPCLR
jgi:hypothetical protein